MGTTESRCEICELPITQCRHGLAEKKRASLVDAMVRVSPNNVAHLDGCPHKGDDMDYKGWGEIHESGAWQHLCSTVPPEDKGLSVVADLVTTHGDVIGLEITHICWDCREHGYWG